MRNHQILIFGLAVLCLARSASAFEYEGAGVRVGVASVFHDFQFEKAQLFDPDSEKTLVGGVSLKWRSSRRARFLILTEAWYQRVGFRRLDNLVWAEMLSLPLLLRSSVATNDPRVYVAFGPSLEILLSNDDDAVLNQYRSFALAGQAALGIEKDLSRRLAASLELRFSSEFTNIYEPRDDADTLVSVRHRLFELTAGISF